MRTGRARVGLITYAHAEPFHIAQMDTVEQAFAAQGRDAEFRRCFGNRDRAAMAAAAEMLATWRPDVILSFMTNADLAVLDATEATRTPIVCWSMDPVDAGLVASMRHPGGRLTAVAFPPGLQAMQLRVLKTLKPGCRRVGMLFNRGYAPAAGALAKLVAAGALFGIEVTAYQALTLDAVRDAIPAMAREGCDGMVVGPHELFNGNGALIGALALDSGLPAIAMDSVVAAGGVFSFMPDFARIWPAAAGIAGRVLDGEPAGSIPVDRHIQPRTTLNLDAASRLGLVLDPAFVDDADRLIGVGGE